MPYATATPSKISGDEVTVDFTGPGISRARPDVFNGQGKIEDWARTKIAEWNTPRSRSTVTVGVPLDLTPPVDPVPTAQQVYNAAEAKVLRHRQAIAAGIYTTADPKFVSDLAAAQAAWAAV